MRVLVVEDESDTAAAIARGLRRQRLAGAVATDGEQALTKAARTGYDVVVPDCNLPLIHGDEVCRRVRSLEPRPAISMLTRVG